MKMKIPTFLKWAGGKRRVIDQIVPTFPKKVDRYFEPFLGAGAIFFYIKKRYNPKYCEISDINKDLIDTFKAVRDHPEELIKHLKYFKRRNSEKYYYSLRRRFNEGKIQGIRRTAAFIYLNKTCYNGLYRVNSNGGFNVPCGKYKNPEIFNKETILEASKLLKGVKIKHQDYRKIIDRVSKGDLIYLDPCYDPLTRTSFVNYTPQRFCEMDRIELSKFMGQLRDKKVEIRLSNNDLPEIRGIYVDYKIKEVFASRKINSDGGGRGKIKELLIINKNY